MSNFRDKSANIKIKKDKWDYIQKQRTIPNRQKYISCFAAFNHMRITRLGNMMPCCFSTVQQIWNKEKGLHDYWFNNLNTQYQSDFLDGKMHKGCNICIERINNKIIPPLVEYDWNVKDRMKDVVNISYPKIFEFEISNLCNMECPMCFGFLSSKHAMNRDSHIDWGKNIFDDDDNLNHLIEEFKEFIPHLEEIRFVGGEPLAHKAMYKIANLVAKIKPELKLQICTNGSIFNKNVERIIKENNIQYSFSVDTIIPEEYQQIRVGGKYEETYANIDKIANLVGSDKIMINAILMSVNAENFIKLFNYSYEREYKIFVNTYDRAGRVTSPDWGLHNVNNNIKKKIINQCYIMLDKINKIKLYNNYENELHKIIKLLDRS